MVVKLGTVCQICRTAKKSTRERRTLNPGYEGPCGDSFCYASCTLDSCVRRDLMIYACDQCTERLP
jgi:hypothetical protein